MEPVLKLCPILCHWTSREAGAHTEPPTKSVLQQPCLEMAGENFCSSRGVIYQHFIRGCKCTELLAAFQDL